MMTPIKSMIAGIFVWFVLTGGAADSWLIGGPVIAALAAAAWRWQPERAYQVHWAAVPSFVAFFLHRSLVAGVDVARRAWSPAMPLAPAVVMHKTLLPAGAPRVFFAGIVSLLPGSLSVSIDSEQIAVHVLDDSMDTTGDLEQVERRIAAIFARTGT